MQLSPMASLDSLEFLFSASAISRGTSQSNGPLFYLIFLFPPAGALLAGFDITPSSSTIPTTVSILTSLNSLPCRARPRVRGLRVAQSRFFLLFLPRQSLA